MTEVPLLDGAMFRPADADGQLLVVYWWASWCPFCAQQTPLMEKLWRAHRTKGLRLLGLSVDRKTEDARDCMARRGYTFPSGLLTPVVARVQPKPKGLPETVVRGGVGKVLLQRQASCSRKTSSSSRAFFELQARPGSQPLKPGNKWPALVSLARDTQSRPGRKRAVRRT